MPRCTLFITIEGVRTYQGPFESQLLAETFAKSTGYPYEIITEK